MPLPPELRTAIENAEAGSKHRLEYVVLADDGRTPVRTDFAGHLEWCLATDGVSARVAEDQVAGYRISTIFVSGPVVPRLSGLEHRPFETMVFGGEANAGMGDKYLSFDDALEGHAAIVTRLTPSPTARGPGFG